MKILGVCTGGGIGDVLAALPAVQALARHYATPVDVLTTPYARAILDGQPSVGTVLTDDGGQPVSELADRIRKLRYTHALVFWSNARTATALARAGIPVRVGQSRRLYSFLYTTRVTVRTETGDTLSHWTDVQMDYARALGVRPEARDYKVEIPLSEDDMRQAQAVLDTLSLREPFVMLHAVRGMSAYAAHWPSESFGALGDALAQEFNAPILLNGSENDRLIAHRIAACMRRPVYNAAGLSSLRALAALAGRAIVVVALDSGPMHVAAAVGAPTVGIFALRTDLPTRWKPLGARVALVEPSYPCPCSCRKETCRTFACYAALPVAQVVAAARSVTVLAPAEIA